MNSKLIRSLYTFVALITVLVAGVTVAQADRWHDRDHDWHHYHHYYTGGYYRAPPPVVYGYPGYAAPPPVVYDENPGINLNFHIH